MKRNASPSLPGRLLSVDVLRGFDMFWIIGGTTIFFNLRDLMDNAVTQAIAGQLDHAAWDGFNFLDLVFPLFLFIVGVVMPFSFANRLESGESRKRLYLRVVKRTLILFALGLVYNGGLGNYSLSGMRVAGVLQRIALCYFFASVVTLNTGVKGQSITAAALLILYWAMMKLVPVPGYGAGILTPEGNLAGYVDRRFLPGQFCCYGSGDNEGILSTIPAISTTLIGALAGHWLRAPSPQNGKALGLLGAGMGSLILGLIWNTSFPINKYLWTSSYVLYAAGWSMLLLCLLYWTIDVCGYQKWAFPFEVIGMNPITIYVLSAFVDFRSITLRFVGDLHLSGSAQPLFLAISVLSLEWLLLFWMHRRKIFLKI